jgi:DNA mismatch repair protein MutS
MTLFATHYFELTELAKTRPGVANVHLDAIEHGAQIVFMHKVKEGPADRSYGLQVAALAGLPISVLATARDVLQELEHKAEQAGALDSEQLSLFASAPAPARSSAPPQDAEPNLEDRQTRAVIAALRALEVDSLRPKDALMLLYELTEHLRRPDEGTR